jgi:hypothetical protein
VLGIDPFSRTLLWAFRYGRTDGKRSQEESAGDYLRRIGDQWTSSAPLIAGDRVIITTPEDGRIHCLGLLDGRLQWQANQQDDVYLAGIFGDRALLIGKHSCRSLRLTDGRQLWELETGRPSGYGVADGPYYHLPLEAGALCKIDVKRGAIVASTPLPHQEIPGNLCFVAGGLVSRTKTGIYGYTAASSDIAP